MTDNKALRLSLRRAMEGYELSDCVPDLALTLIEAALNIDPKRPPTEVRQFLFNLIGGMFEILSEHGQWRIGEPEGNA